MIIIWFIYTRLYDLTSLLKNKEDYIIFKSQEVVAEQATINPIECNLINTFYHDFD